MSETLSGEIGRVHGVVFVDCEGNPVPVYRPSKCPSCSKTESDGVYWTSHQFFAYYEIGASRTAWHCPFCSVTWTTNP